MKKGEIVARLENADVTATMEEAAANVALAKANLQQAQAELIEAQAVFDRNGELLAKGFISQSAYDAYCPLPQGTSSNPCLSGVDQCRPRQTIAQLR